MCLKQYAMLLDCRYIATVFTKRAAQRPVSYTYARASFKTFKTIKKQDIPFPSTHFYHK